MEAVINFIAEVLRSFPNEIIAGVMIVVLLLFPAFGSNFRRKNQTIVSKTKQPGENEHSDSESHDEIQSGLEILRQEEQKLSQLKEELQHKEEALKQTQEQIAEEIQQRENIQKQLDERRQQEE